MVEELEQKAPPKPRIPQGQTIAQAQIQGPTVPKAKRRIPERLVAGVLGVVVVVGLVSVYLGTRAEPEPYVPVDPELQAKAVKKKRALRALERGHELVQQGPERADAAIAAYQEALELEPGLADAVRGIAISHAAKNDGPQAIRFYRRYLQLAPDAPDAADVRKIIKSFRRRR
jgi:tetratricopeptide (TPR) repeat protein